jgi:hypothetical protein
MSVISSVISKSSPIWRSRSLNIITIQKRPGMPQALKQGQLLRSRGDEMQALDQKAEEGAKKAMVVVRRQAVRAGLEMLRLRPEAAKLRPEMPKAELVMARAKMQIPKAKPVALKAATGPSDQEILVRVRAGTRAETGLARIPESPGVGSN